MGRSNFEDFSRSFQPFLLKLRGYLQTMSKGLPNKRRETLTKPIEMNDLGESFKYKSLTKQQKNS